MKHIILFCCLLLVNVPAQSQTWVHVYGVSWHDRSGYREINTGLGVEHQFAPQWSWVAGTFQNSIDRQSVVGMIKYQGYQQGNWSVNMQLGGVTGYRDYTVAPVILPEACWRWVCGMFIPEISNESTAAGAVYLRIPL